MSGFPSLMASPARVHKERLDRMLMAQGLVPSREAAARTVLAGGVSVDGIMVDKPAKLVSPDARIEIVRPASFVSRAGDKLAAALDAFHIDPRGAIGLDVGCSTGGFTDCLLQRGAPASMPSTWDMDSLSGNSGKIRALSCSNGLTFVMLTVQRSLSRSTWR